MTTLKTKVAQKRVAAYTRVSTEKQATEEKVSLGEQRKDIEAYCALKGYEIVNWYSDIGSGASKRRKDFQRMLKECPLDKFDVIIAWKSDRLSRGMYPAVALMEAIEGTRVGLEAVKDTIDIKTFGIMAAVGKIELDNIRERAQMGARGRAAKGKLWGSVKYGYMIGEDGRPAINESEAHVVARIFQEYVSGNNPRPIADGLNAEGILTRFGNIWCNDDIWRIIRDSIYKGEGHYMRRRFFTRDNGERDVRIREMRPEEEWIPIAFPVIVDQAAWDTAQEFRKRSARISAKTGLNLKFPLRGLIWCGTCGSRFVGDGRSGYNKRYRRKDGTLWEKRVNSTNRRYRCLRTKKKLNEVPCPRKGVSAIEIEKLVWEVVYERLGSIHLLRELAETRKREFEEHGTTEELEKAERSLETAQKERAKRLQQHAQEYVTDDELSFFMRNISDRLGMHTEEVERLEKEAKNYTKEIEYLDEIVESGLNLKDRLDSMNQEERDEALGLFVKRIVIEPNDVQIVLALGAVTQGLATANSL